MPTADDVRQEVADRHAWIFNPSDVAVHTPGVLDPRSTAARVEEDRQAAAKERAEDVDQLQAERQGQLKDRRRRRGLSTAQILAARSRRSA